MNMYWFIGIIYCNLCIQNVYGWGNSPDKKVLLKNVDSITLYDGKMTNGRRSSAVPQMECINEGSSSCYDFKPKIAQCTNKGSDGVDVQWECKSDMDSKYKFGFIEVTCEGYDYPDDPYVLAGSCGLRYTLDHSAKGDDHYSGNNYHGSSYNSYKNKSSMATTFANMITYAGIALMIYAVYKTCFRSGREVGDNAYSSTSDDYPSDNGGGGYGWFGGQNTSNPSHHRSSYSDDASCRNRGTYQARQGGGSGLGGFWTGAATGGLLGYMFGGGRNSNGYGNYGGRSYGYGGRSYGSGGMFSGGGGGFGSSGGYSGSRTSTGFGGTSRR